MSELNAPDRYVPAFEAFARLDAQERRAVVDRVAAIPLFSSSSEIERAFEEIDSISDPELATGALTGALMVLEDQSPDGLLKAATDLANSPKLDLSDAEREQLAEFLHQVLALPATSTSAKAEAMLFEGERIFLSCRIVTDIRPVFGSDVATAPQGAILRHMLRVEFLKANGDRDSLFVALDPADLEELGGTIERATQKAESIKDLLPEAGLSLFEITSDDDDST